MKLYYSPGACSLSPHIALHESGLPFEAVLASTKTHQLPDGSDFYKVNPLGYVPALHLDDGTLLTEGVAIVQYIADQAAGKNLAPANGTLARYQLQSWLNFISTELHKGFSPLFYPTTPAEYKDIAKEKLLGRLKHVDAELGKREYIAGDHFTVADGYLFTVLSWSPYVGVDLAAFPNIQAFQARVGKRPGVQAALQAEGLLK